MTRRERLAAKLAKREEWAAGRAAKAAALLATTERFRGDHAFNTQPGHIPERARVIAREDRAFEHLDMAREHEAKAAGLETQLDASIFSDDVDAIEQLEARITENEAARDRIKAYNATSTSCQRRLRSAHDSPTTPLVYLVPLVRMRRRFDG